MSQYPHVPACDSWEEDVQPPEAVPTTPSTQSQTSTDPQVKPSKMKRYLSRTDKHVEFCSLSPEEALARVEANENCNQEKKAQAQREKWHRQQGGEWQRWRGEWFWHEWQYKERWSKPY